MMMACTCWSGNEPQTLDVDTIILCTGQTPLRTLYTQLSDKGVTACLIGGAFEAGELDAKRAINQASCEAAAV